MLTARLIRKLAALGAPLPGRLPAPDSGATCLTFDDGPHPEITPRVLDLLATHNVKAIFLLVGWEAERHPAIVQRIHREGHIVGNHTYSHPVLPRLSTPAALADVEKCQQLIEPLGGTRVFRPPHGLLNASQYRGVLRAGYRLAYWTLDTRDYAGPVAADFLQRDVRGQTLLFHDNRPHCLAALQQLLPAPRARFGLPT